MHLLSFYFHTGWVCTAGMCR